MKYHAVYIRNHSGLGIASVSSLLSSPYTVQKVLNSSEAIKTIEAGL